MKPFRTPMSALIWWHREMSRRDGLRAQPCDPRAVSAINKSKTPEDRLLLLGLIGDVVRQTQARYRRAVLLVVRDNMGPAELSAHLGCSPRWAGETIRRAWADVGERLRDAGVMEETRKERCSENAEEARNEPGERIPLAEYLNHREGGA